MMGRIFTIAAMVLFCVGNLFALTGSGTELDPWLIGSLADFHEFAGDPNYWDDYTHLEADIDLAGITYTTAVIAPDTDNSTYDYQGTPFTGTFDGNGYTIYNLIIDAGLDYLGLFGSVNHASAEIKNLGLDNINITSGNHSHYLGGLCAENLSGSINNCYSNGYIHDAWNRLYLGGLCGRNYGNISNCHSTVSVDGGHDSDYIGGLCGENTNGSISNCYATGSVTGYSYLGGLCGYNPNGNISNCYSTSPVAGGYNSDNIGGLCGRSFNGIIINCYATGSVSGDDDVGGLCGRVNGGGVSSCYFLDTSGPDNGYGTPLTDSQMRQQASFVGWDFTDETANGTEDIWYQPSDNLDYPHLAQEVPIYGGGTGSESDPYLIASAEHLIVLGQWPLHYNMYFVLTADIDMVDYPYTSAVIAPSGSAAFIGIFDGNGHTISNLTIDGGSYLGLFGKINNPNAEVKNLFLENVNITGYELLGGLCGMNNGIISNCYSIGAVTGRNWSSSLGVMCGENNSIIINCYSNGSVTAGDYSFRLGSLCGENTGSIISSYANGVVISTDYSGSLSNLCGDNSGNIINCYATGSVSGHNRLGSLCGENSGSIINSYATGSVSGSGSLGGLCGSNDGSIISSYATGPVSGRGGLGGLCGQNFRGSISNCYATGSVTAEDNADNVGGLCGYNFNGDIRDCYSVGSVTGEDDSEGVGGLCGYQEGDDAEISDCFWDIETSDMTVGYILDSPYPGTIINVHGKTTGQMQTVSTFTDAGWDFDPDDGDPADWLMPISDYPKLYFQPKIDYIGSTVIFLNLNQAASLQLDIYSLIDLTLNWTITGHESCPWITSLDPNSGVTTGPADLTTVTIDIDAATLTYGIYACDLTLAADNGDYVTIPIRLHVTLAGSGTQIDPFLIESFADFQIFSDSAYAEIYWSEGAYTQLECDLDLDPALPGRQNYDTAVIAPDMDTSNSEFDGIAFTGTFDGNGHTINNLTIDTAGVSNDYLGLFGKIDGLDDDPNGEVINLGLEDFNIIGGDLSNYLGGLCGVNYGSISDSYTDGLVIGGIDYSVYIGGLCGYNYKGSLSNCASSGSTYGGEGAEYIGGLCGYNEDGSISSCLATGIVIGGYNSDNLGGLCGYNDYGNISSCFATGIVTSGYNSDNLGGLCGHNEGGSISKCYATASVSGWFNSYILGGLCGYNYGGQISDCYATGPVTGGHESNQLGGLCGYQYGDMAEISDCFWDIETSGMTTGYNQYPDHPGTVTNVLGKTTSQMQTVSTFTDAGWDFDPDDGDPADWVMPISDYPLLYFQSKITYLGSTLISLVPNQVDSIQLDIYNLVDVTLNWTITGYESCPWITDLYPDSGISTGPTDLTTVTIDIDTTTLDYGIYTCDLTLAADNGDSATIPVRLHITLSGSGTQVDPFLIENFSDFQVFSDPNHAAIYWSRDVYTQLECDLDLTGQVYTKAVIAPATNIDRYWQGAPFLGQFDGNGHTINNLTINSSYYYLGLFGMIDTDGSVANLGLTNINIVGSNWYVGGLCGYNLEGSIINCYVTGSVSGDDSIGGLCGVNHYSIITDSYATGSVSGDRNIGGLCGSNNHGVIIYSFATGSVIGNENFGGLCGINYRGNISYCYATGSVTGGNNADNLGGLCGSNYIGSISNCYATGPVTGGDNALNLGGLCGYNDNGSNISNCYATGSVTGGNGAGKLGGLCGYNDSYSSISYCYSTGPVTGGVSSTRGGLCGYQYGDDTTEISNCFWDIDTSGMTVGYNQDSRLPGTITNVLGKTTDQMQTVSTFTDAGWDFDPDDGDPANWFMLPMHPPQLYWQFTIVYTGQPEIPMLQNGSDSIQIDVFSLVDETLNWTITGHEFCPWITNLAPDNGVSTGFTDLTTVTIDIDNATLATGSYACDLTLAANNGDQITIPIRLHIPLAGAGTLTEPVLIGDLTNFQIFSDPAYVEIYWSSGIYSRLECDLDLTGQVFNRAVIAPDIDIDDAWDGIPFTGYFDGNGHTISNVSIIDGKSCAGLFGYIGTGGSVSNLGLVNIDIDARKYVGGLCGANAGSIRNSYVIGLISGNDYLGGLCGYNYEGSISDSYATGSVSGSSYLGGLCGYNHDGNITGSYMDGSVSGSNHLGGLCGYNLSGNITDSYVTGSVIGSSYLGGLCGYNSDGIGNCYSASSVTGNSNLGGLCGWNDTGSISSCYFLETAGPDNGLGTPLTDSAMKQQGNFSGWDFMGVKADGTEDIWRMCVDGFRYPKLAWAFPVPDYKCPDSVDHLDFAVFAQSWLSTPADTHWNPACNLHINDRIDIYDLMIFCEYWLYPPDFIAHWKLDETSDNIAHDSRIFGLDGKLQGDASWTAGHIDNAVSLDGDGDYIALGNTDFLKPPLPITFALWIKLASLTDYQVIISLDTNNTAGDHRFYGSELLLMNTGEVAVSYGDGQSDLSMRYKIGNTQLEKDTWYHIAGVISGPEDMDIYINGELDDSDTYGGSGGPMTYLGGPAYLGSRNGSECYVHGQLDDVRIYTRALSELEIQNLAFQ